MIIAFVIFFGGVQIVSRSINSLINSTSVKFNILLIITLLISVLGMSAMFYALKERGIIHSSPPFKATARDNLTDIFASIFAMAGVIGAQKFLVFDPLMGCIVSIWIFKTGYDTANENIEYLIGASPTKSFQTKIKEVIPQIEGVKGVHNILTYYAGTKVNIEAHIEVNSNFSLREAHALREKVENHILKLEGVNKVYLHTDPTPQD